MRLHFQVHNQNRMLTNVFKFDKFRFNKKKKVGNEENFTVSVGTHKAASLTCKPTFKPSFACLFIELYLELALCYLEVPSIHLPLYSQTSIYLLPCGMKFIWFKIRCYEFCSNGFNPEVVVFSSAERVE